MSRNICRVDCDRCNGKVRPTEAPRLATAADVGRHPRYIEEYAGKMWVAAAGCARCGARYLAWFNYPDCEYIPGRDHCDLSFRESFNDEPGPTDLPPFEGDA